MAASTREWPVPVINSARLPGLAILAAAHAVVLLAFPNALTIALGIWWNSNTISHNFIHRGFFRRRWANAVFAAFQSVLLGIPQSLWRDRHLAHHAGVNPRVRISKELAIQVLLILGLWTGLGVWDREFFALIYVPGYLAGLALCWVHGYYEHARGTTSHYGRLYNIVFLNDGYHAEHHADPSIDWGELPSRRVSRALESSWPPPLRWLDDISLEGLERLVLRSVRLQRWVLRVHSQALKGLLGGVGLPDSVTVVGGGLFPRTILILRELMPLSSITVVDGSGANIKTARAFQRLDDVEFVHAEYDANEKVGSDLLVIPLSLRGDRAQIYSNPPAPAVLVHDWIWRKRGESRVVSWLLLKRINLVLR